MATATDWPTTTIGKLCSFSSGHGFSKADWSESGLPIIRIQNLNGSRQFNYYDREPDPSWIIEPGELLFAWAGVKGVSFGPTIWAGPRGLLNQHIYRIRPKKGVDLRWLYLSLQVVTSLIEANAHGFKSNLVHVRQSDITGQEWHLPPETEQTRIAAILTSWESACNQLESLIEAKARLRTGLMQQLLTGSRRFPEFRSTNFITSQIGDVMREQARPIAWDDGSLYQLASVRRYSGGLFWREALHGHSIKVKKLNEIRTGDFLISHIQAAYGAMGIVPPEFNGGKVSDMYSILVPKDTSRIDVRYFDYLSQRPRMRYQAYLACNGFFAERLRLNFDPAEFLRQEVTIPETIAEQRKTVDVLSTLDAEIDNLGKQLVALKQQRKGLTLKLLTGQVRVKVAP